MYWASFSAHLAPGMLEIERYGNPKPSRAFGLANLFFISWDLFMYK